MSTSKKYNSSIYNTIKDTFSLWMSEVSKTVSKLFETPSNGKGQVSAELENMEIDLIEERKKIND